jgi:hypothetical protein
MHLALIDGPFLLHNLISAQQSPVPLPKFQMAHRIKILMVSVQERNPDILSFSLKKYRQVKPLQVPQRGPYGEIPTYGTFYISLYLKDPKKRASLHVPQKWAPMEMPIPEPYVAYLSGVKESSLQDPPHGVPSEKEVPFLDPSSIHHSKSSVYS